MYRVLLFSLLLVSLFVFGLQPVCAQEHNISFMNLSSADGLSSDMVNAILKDKYGYMWFATEDGLNKFDGNHFTTYRHNGKNNNSIGSNQVLALHEDAAGNLWVGTNAGIAMYDRQADSFLNFDLLSNIAAISISSDALGKIWIGGHGGLRILNARTRKFEKLSLFGSQSNPLMFKSIPTLYRDRQNRMWLGANDGLYLYHSSRKKFMHYNIGNKTADNHVSAIVEDLKGNIWVGSIQGVSMLAQGKDSLVNYRHNPANPQSLSSNLVYAMGIEPQGTIWIGTEEGLNLLNPLNGKVVRVKQDGRNNYSLVGKAVKSILIDKQGIYWVATYHGGINKYDKNLPFFNLRQASPFDPMGLSASVVTSFARGEGPNVYVGTDGGGLNCFNLSTGRFTHPPLPATHKQLAILAMDRVEDELWIGTFLDGVFVYNIKTGKSRQILAGPGPREISSNEVFCIKKDSRGMVWIGTNGQGIDVYDPHKHTFYRYNGGETGARHLPTNNFIRVIEEDKEGKMWVGTVGSGIAVLDVQAGKAQLLNTTNCNLPNNYILSIHQAQNGTVWVGTNGGGLSRYNKAAHSFESFSEENGLGNAVIYKILEDYSGKLWVSTNKGISSFDPQTLKFRNYWHHNGLQGRPFVMGAGLTLPNGQLFFGGAGGFNYFKPSELHTNKTQPRVVLTDLRIANHSVKPSESSAIREHISIANRINLDYRQNFSLSFVALNYTSPQENRYLYKLDNFDKDWNRVDKMNTAYYTNLDPGEYVFHVKAISESGDWSTPATSIRILVRPPIWLTPFAYLLYLVGVLSVLFYIRYLGIRKLKATFAAEQEKVKLLQRIEEERRESERKHEFDQSKIEFLTNLSHEFRTPISLIMGPVDHLLQTEPNSLKSQQLNMVRRNARRLLNLVNQLLDFRNIEERELKLNTAEGDFVAFARDVAESFKDLSERKQIRLEFRSAVRFYFTQFDHDKIERVIFNLLSNAFKFTLKGGNVAFAIERHNSCDGLKIIVTDTGVGIAENDKNLIFERFFRSSTSVAVLNQGSGIGLSITKEFVEMHGGTIEVESEPGKGTTFTVCLPLKESGHEEVIDTQIDADVDSTFQTDDIEAELIDLPADLQYEDIPTVLIVEDNDDFRHYLKTTLDQHYRIIEATNGKEGWQRVLSAHPQLVVSDISMPYVSGIELCQKIKADKRTSHIPVLLLTALTAEDDQLAGLEIGANDYLTKPFRADLLSMKIRNLLILNQQMKSAFTRQVKVVGSEIKIERENEKLLTKVVNHIEENLTNPQLSVQELSRSLGMSRGTLYSKILDATGQTPVEYIRAVKLDRAAILLEKSDMNVAQVCYSVGFATPNHFSRAFKSRFNQLPSEYMNNKRKHVKGSEH
jgi:signal transduction histidine kinase/ligand-binding sensor domain-containing protein/DNA-binding response OmpR family regulator